MHENEFHRLLPVCLARGFATRLGGAPQLDDDAVRAVFALLAEALADAPRTAGEWVLSAWRRAVDADRAERLVLAVGWLEAPVIAGWGHHLAREALGHVQERVRAAAIRALRRWNDPASVALLRTANAETVPALVAELHAARDELDPCAVPSIYERSAGARALRAGWDRRRRSLVPSRADV